MTDLRFDLDTRETPMEIVMRALPRVVLGAAFILIGMTKFSSPSTWAPVFQRIGLGDWFRYFTGGMQMAGGVLALIPRTAIVGAGLIACTMAGAVVADLFIMRAGVLAVVPLALFAFAVGVGVQAWANAQ